MGAIKYYRLNIITGDKDEINPRAFKPRDIGIYKTETKTSYEFVVTRTRKRNAKYNGIQYEIIFDRRFNKYVKAWED